MQMASALPLGFTSDCEMIDILLDEQVEPAIIKEQLMAKMAPGITLHSVAEVSLTAPALQNSTVAGRLHRHPTRPYRCANLATSC